MLTLSLFLSYRVAKYLPLEAIPGNLGVAYKNMKTRPSIREAMSHHSPLKVVRTSIVSKNQASQTSTEGKTIQDDGEN